MMALCHGVCSHYGLYEVRGRTDLIIVADNVIRIEGSGLVPTCPF